MMRWWWYGPAVTKPELERELRMMKAGGMGGVEIQATYPLDLDDPAQGFRNLRYLSPEFMDALRFTAEKGRELGLRIDLTLGSGWPYGGPSIPITQAAGRLRCDRVPVAAGAREVAMPKIAEGERFIGAFLARGDQRSFLPDGFRELTDVSASGVKLPEGLNGPHVVLLFISSRTKMMVKRAAFGAEGYVLDHYDRTALDTYLKTVGEPLLKGFGPKPPYAIFSDSLEVFASDWTGDLLDEFRKRRGYDLKPYLPALVGDIGAKTGAIRNDWVVTLTELCDDRYLKPMAEFAHKRGTLFRSQTYGTPPVTLSSNQFVDLPEGEQPFWNRFTPARWATSAGHLFDRPVISSETWTWLHSPSFRATPLDMKVEADRHFLEGVNQLVGHGWPYSPERAGEPGYRFYAAAVFNHHNPWWIVMPDVTAYLQRVSFLMRRGKPANDVALYLPSADARAQITTGRASIDRLMEKVLSPDLIPQILSAGYNFDFIDDGTIGKLQGRYPVIVLPGVERIPVETLRAIEAYRAKGGIVIATGRAPSLSPGLIDAEKQSREVGTISKRLFPAVVATETLGAELRRLYRPDMAVEPITPDIGFMHRKDAGGEIYFIANTGNQPRKVQATFRVEGLPAEWWDPFTGATEPARASAAGKNGTTLELDLEPYGSRVVVFSKGAAAVASSAKAAAPPAGPLDLSSGWSVTFGTGGRPVAMETLRSWTESPDTRFYSGTATYEKKVTVPAALAQRKLTLDFGEAKPQSDAQRGPGMRAWLDAPVRDAAVVYINGKRAGSVWKPPYTLDVTGMLKPGENAIRIEVANTAINLLAKGPLPDYKALKERYGDRFQPQDMNNLKPFESGLLGRIVIR